MNRKNRAFTALALALASVLGVAAYQAPVRKRAANAAPELVGGPWINTKGGAAAPLAARAGKPTLVAFWTFGCSNCQANIAPYGRLLARYRPKGVEMISVHTPEMRVERDVEEVKRHVGKFAIDYPVVVDGKGLNWDRWGVRYWPTLFLLDGEGRVVRRWEGELNWQGANGEGMVAAALDTLLAGRSLPQ